VNSERPGDYEGEHITDSLLKECIDQAQAQALVALAEKKWV
jgi:hypothetical protein